MKKNWKKVLLTITAVLVAAGLAGCGKEMQQEIQQDRQSSRLKVPKSKESVTDRRYREKRLAIVVMGPSSGAEAGFDPVYGWGAGEHVHEPLIQSTLTVTNKDLTIGYDLATDMKTSEDGLTWTVTIRLDVKFNRRGRADSKGCGVYLQYVSG